MLILVHVDHVKYKLQLSEYTTVANLSMWQSEKTVLTSRKAIREGFGCVIPDSTEQARLL